MKKMILRLNTSLKTKGLYTSLDGTEIVSVRDKGWGDFWNTFMGWILSMPNTYQYNHNFKIKLKRKLSFLTIRFIGEANGDSITVKIANPVLERKKIMDIIKINGQKYQMYRANRSMYFSIFDHNNKYLVMQRDSEDKDKYKLVFNETKFSRELAFMLSMCLVDSI